MEGPGSGAVKECWYQECLRDPWETQSPRANMWREGHSPLCCGEPSPCPSDRAVPTHFPKTRLLCTSLIDKCLEETQLHHFMSIQAIQMNRGNKGFSLYRTTSGLNVTVMSTVSFNSAETLLCDSLLCSLITNSRNTNSNISV